MFQRDGHLVIEARPTDFPWYLPLAEKMLREYPLPEDGIRYFRHFKGSHYRYIRMAFDSETKERMVIYQALYGDKQYWIRPEKMFFETVTRDGRKFARFTEIESETIIRKINM